MTAEAAVCDLGPTAEVPFPCIWCMREKGELVNLSSDCCCSQCLQRCHAFEDHGQLGKGDEEGSIICNYCLQAKKSQLQ